MHVWFGRLALALVMSCVSIAGHTADTTPPTPKPKLDSLLVHGDGWMFAVKEPESWNGDTENASQMEANVLFYRKGENPSDAKTLIRVVIAEKSDDDTAQDLRADMEAYKQRYPDIQFRDFEVQHPSYRPFAKLFYVPGKFFEYVAYLNPGPHAQSLFSVSMNKQVAEADAEELAAYRAVVRSLNLFASGGIAIPRDTAAAAGAGDFAAREKASRDALASAEGQKYEASWGDVMGAVLRSCIAPRSTSPKNLGKFTFVANVDAAGGVSSVDVRPSTDVSRCFAKRFSVAKLPPPPSSPRSEFLYPIADVVSVVP